MLFRVDRKKLYIALAAECISVKELMSLAKVSAVTLQRIGDDKPLRPNTLGRIAKALHVTPQDLIE